MNKITLKGKSLDLNGTILKVGDQIDFKAIDRNQKERHFSELNGLVIISTFPDIETKICDIQTQEIAKLASKHPNINFLSITTDSVEKINKWCAANNVGNVDIWSDKFLEFGKNTNTLIPEIEKLTRGFYVVKDQKIVAESFKTELTDMPDFDLINKYI